MLALWQALVIDNDPISSSLSPVTNVIQPDQLQNAKSGSHDEPLALQWMDRRLQKRPIFQSWPLQIGSVT